MNPIDGFARPSTGAWSSPLVVGDEVQSALAERRPVVALETTIISHGLPRPSNLEVARQIERAVRSAGGVPATCGVLGGRLHVGLDDADLERFAHGDDVAKLSSRDLALAAAKRLDGATTVAATVTLAAAAGITVMATGGVGGVHRRARDTWDVSGDLQAIRANPVAVVAAGVKSILDVPATLEHLETLGVPVVGWMTSSFPGFYVTDSGHRIDWSVHDIAEAAEVVCTHLALPGGGGLLLANPIASEHQLDPDLHDRVIADALARMETEGVSGKEVTPYLLAALVEATGGASVEANRRLVVANALLAARLAAAVAASP